MTGIEFEQWVEQHRAYLLRLARKNLGGSSVQPEDVVSQALMSIVQVPGRVESIIPRAVATYVSRAVAYSTRYLKRQERASTLRDNAYYRGENYPTPGAQKGNEHRGKHIAVFDGCQGVAEMLVGNPGGIARWRYQQRRDARLFDGAAVRSLSESIRGVSRRYRYFDEFGVPIVSFGVERSGPGEPYDPENVPWTQVSGLHPAPSQAGPMDYDVTLDPDRDENDYSGIHKKGLYGVDGILDTYDEVGA